MPRRTISVRFKADPESQKRAGEFVRALRGPLKVRAVFELEDEERAAIRAAAGGAGLATPDECADWLRRQALACLRELTFAHQDDDRDEG